MARNIIQVAKDFLTGKNTFNKAFFQYVGAGFTNYDQDGVTYIEKGYNMNADVYACISQMTTKTVSVPYTVKKINDKKAFHKLKMLSLATKGNHNFLQAINKKNLETKAYDDVELDFPLENPNETQTWSDIWALYKTYLKPAICKMFDFFQLLIESHFLTRQ